MPTSEEFYHYAAQFEDLADSAQVLGRGPAGLTGADVVNGGNLGRAVTASLDAADANGQAAARRLRELAQTCRHRAEVVAAYAAEVDAYNRAVERYRTRRDLEFGLNPLPNPLPTPPDRPAAWVDL